MFLLPSLPLYSIDGEVIPSIVEKPVKSLGRWNNSILRDQRQVSELRELIVKAIGIIDIYKTLPNNLELWCLQCGLLPLVRWPLTVYEVAISEI